MAAGIIFATRVVLALVVVLGVSAGVGAQAATSEVAVVAPIFQTPIPDLGSTPRSVTFSRIIFTPGSRDGGVYLPGPRLVLVETGTLAFHASGLVPVVKAALPFDPGRTGAGTPVPTPTPTPAPEPTPTIQSTPTTDRVLNPGDVVPVPIWTMHSFVNEGSDPAVILDIRIAPRHAPGLPTGLDVELLAEESELTALPTGRAAVALGHSTIAPGGMLLAPPTGRYELVAATGGGGAIAPATDGSVVNPGPDALAVYVLAVAPRGAIGPREPAQPVIGPGGADVAFDRVVATHYGAENRGYWLYEPAAPHPGTRLATAAPLPVILFLGGCCVPVGAAEVSDRPLEVQAWIDHLTQRGAIVVYPEMRPDFGLEDAGAALRAAIAELGNGGHVEADWARFAVFGFSFGGWYAPLFAATAPAAGLPVPVAVLSTVAFDPGTTPDLSGLSASTHVVVLVGDETTGWSDHGPRRLWAAMTSAPPDRRAFVRVVSDARGVPALIAQHGFPATGDWESANTLDWYGTWKVGDALLSCAFADEDCHYVFGDTPEVRFMGYWSDGVPVNEMEVIAVPRPPDPETPTPSPGG